MRNTNRQRECKTTSRPDVSSADNKFLSILIWTHRTYCVEHYANRRRLSPAELCRFSNRRGQSGPECEKRSPLHTLWSGQQNLSHKVLRTTLGRGFPKNVWELLDFWHWVVALWEFRLKGFSSSRTSRIISGSSQKFPTAHSFSYSGRRHFAIHICSYRFKLFSLMHGTSMFQQGINCRTVEQASTRTASHPIRYPPSIQRVCHLPSHIFTRVIRIYENLSLFRSSLRHQIQAWIQDLVGWRFNQ